MYRQAESRGLCREVTYFWLFLFHTSSSNCFTTRLASPQLTSATLSPYLSHNPKDCSQSCFPLVTEISIKCPAISCMLFLNNLTSAILKQNKHCPRQNKNPSIHSIYNLLACCLCTLNTRVHIPLGLFLRPWFLNTMSPVQQQDHSKGILIPSTTTYAVNFQCSFPLPPTAMTVHLLVGTHNLSDHEIILLQNSFLFLVFLSFCCPLNPFRIQYLAHLLLTL